MTREEHETFLRQGRDALGALLEPQRRKQRFVLYQLELDEQKAIPFAFKELAALQKAGYEQPPAAMYRMVGAGEVYCPVEQSDAEILKRLFTDCGRNCRRAATGGQWRSLMCRTGPFSPKGLLLCQWGA